MSRNDREELIEDCPIAGCGGTATCKGGDTRTMFDGAVEPFCKQLSAQHSRAASTSGVSFCMSAALQQSIPSIGWPMLHDCSPKCRGTPANAPPDSTSKRIKDASRFLKVVVTLLKSRNRCQATVNHFVAKLQRTSRAKQQGPCRVEVEWLCSVFEFLNDGSSKNSQTLRVIPQQLVWW